MKLLYLVDHPIQYQAPLLRQIAAEPGIDLLVLFVHGGSTQAAYDKGFGRDVQWDVPLTEGYANRVEPSEAAVAEAIFQADIVWMHGWNGRRYRQALSCARKCGVPVLMRGENTLAAMPDGTGPRGWLKRRYLNWIFDRCAGFLCIGSENRAYFKDHGVGDDRLFSMPYAVDNAFFRARCDEAQASRAAFRAELGLAPGRPVVLYAGKLQPRKNPLTAIEAFDVMDRTQARDPYLVFVGDGQLRDDVEKAAKDMSSIRFMGFRNQTELPAFYDVADVFVLASHKEPWGLAVNEAMNGACIPVVSDECGCAADLVDPSCGRIVPPGDARALAAALTEVLADADTCAAMGRAAQTRVSTWGFDQDVEGLKAALTALGLELSQS